MSNRLHGLSCPQKLKNKLSSSFSARSIAIHFLFLYAVQWELCYDGTRESNHYRTVVIFGFFQQIIELNVKITRILGLIHIVKGT
jgi:hypothetical protein